MFPSTNAFTIFLEQHFDAKNDCRMLRRIECAVRGEELFLSFSTAPAFVQTLMHGVFDFYKWSHLTTDGTVPVHVMMAYLKATTTVFEMRNDTCFDGLIAFGHFVDAYFSAMKRMNSCVYFALPERSSDDSTNEVCNIFERCQTDPLPDFFAGEHIDIFKLPSRTVNLPDVLPPFMRTHEEPIQILQRAVESVLGA